MSKLGLTTNMLISHAEINHSQTEVISVDVKGNVEKSTWKKIVLQIGFCFNDLLEKSSAFSNLPIPKYAKPMSLYSISLFLILESKAFKFSSALS